MTLREFTNNTYYNTPLKIIDYYATTDFCVRATPMTLDGFQYLDIMEKEVKSWGLGNGVLEIQIDLEG